METDPNAPVPSTASLVVLFLRIAFTALTRAFISPFRGSRGAPTYLKDVIYAVVRKQLAITTIAQSRYLGKSTSNCYAAWVTSNNLPNMTEELDNGARGHWLGDQNADRVFVYYHGGAYTQSLQPGYFNFMNALKDLLSASGKSVSFVVLAYTLAPEATYPTQLIQAATLFNHVLKKRSPSALTLMGDSAGGNLTLAVLSHILHPHPDARVPPIKLSEPLAGVLAISPWVSFAAESPSYERNAEKDLVGPVRLKEFSDLFIGKGNLHDKYSEPIRAGSKWWKDASKSASRIMIWAGEQEILIDSIEKFADDFSAGWKSGGGNAEDLTVVVTAKHAHVEPLIDAMMQSKTKGEGSLAIENWLKQGEKQA